MLTGACHNDRRVDYPLFAVEQCACNTGANMTCSACVAQRGCAHIRDGKMTVELGNYDLRIQITSNNGVGGLCVPGSISRAPDTTIVLSETPRLVARITANSWCYGQCFLPGLWYLITIVSASAITALLGFYMLYRLCSPASRAHQSQTGYHLLP